MKFRPTGRIVLALLVSLAVGLGVSACGTSFTLGYVYAISGKTTPGQISAFKIDSGSGALTPTRDKFYPVGQLPIAIVATPDGHALFVVNNGDNTVISFIVGGDGKLFAQHTVNTAGTAPVAAAVDKTGKLLFVLDTFAPGFSNSLPGPGQIDVFAISDKGDISSSPTTSISAGLTPTGIAVSPGSNGSFAYVVQQGSQSVATFSVDPSSGALTPLGAPVHAGVEPFAVVEDPTNRFVYVTDSTQNLILGYIVQSDGSLVAMLNGPFRTDLRPRGITVDPRGKYLYTANFNANNIGAYAIDQNTGNPTAVTPSSNGAGAGPSCVSIEPATGRDVYTANFIDGTVSGSQLNAGTGGLVTLQNSPYNTQNGDTTCVVSVANGSHAVQHVQP